MMGEFGWIGLFLFLGLGVLTWRNAQRLIQLGKASAEQAWARDLGAMIQVSMIGFAVTGAFLSMALFDLPYNIMAMATLALKFALAEKEKMISKPSAPGQPQKPAALQQPRRARNFGLP
jgi:hypothetical protein